MSEFSSKAISMLTAAAGKIIVAILVLIVGRIIINALAKGLKKLKSISKLDPTVQGFIHSIVRILLNFILVIIIVQVLGIPMASLVTVLASAGLAIGLSLQGALANCAGGIMILIFKPFQVGDYVNASGAEGIVEDITVFYTHLLTLDNKRITVPNGALMNANVTNFSCEEKRRVDLVFKAAFGTDNNFVQGLMLKAAEGTKGVVAEPAPFARFSGCADNAQEYTLRAWCASADYWDVYFDLLGNVSAAFAEAGVAAPATKLDVKMDK